jgi:hypothetical protein
MMRSIFRLLRVATIRREKLRSVDVRDATGQVISRWTL